MVTIGFRVTLRTHDIHYAYTHAHTFRSVGQLMCAIANEFYVKQPFIIDVPSAVVSVIWAVKFPQIQTVIIATDKVIIIPLCIDPTFMLLGLSATHIFAPFIFQLSSSVHRKVDGYTTIEVARANVDI